MIKKITLTLVAIVLVIGAILAFGPREPVDETIAFLPASLGSDLDAYLKESEAKIADIVPGAEKQIVWQDPASKAKTPISIVYLHGFSATLEETRPMPDLIANQLGANLYYARLKGHGRNGEAMAQATINDWFNDTAEALAIGRAIGEKVIVVAVSTGATFATWAAGKPDLISDVAGLVMISPNYELNNPAAPLLTFGAARYWITTLVGAQRSFEPSNADHKKWWTNEYPTVAVLPMAESLRHVAKTSFDDIGVPALFIYHPEDKVVKSSVTKEIAGRWGKNTSAKATVHEISASEDPYNHVIAGRILSPSNSQPLADKAVEWARSLN